MDKVKLEQQADLLFENLEGWEEKALQRIGTRIGKIGGMTVADVRTLNNIADVKGDIDIIMRELAEVTGYNISQVQKIYGEILSEQHLENKYLYDYRNKDFVPFAENKELQSIVRAYSKSTAETMINLSKTSMIGFFDDRTGFHGIQAAYYDAVDKAVMAVTSGATDFNTAMRDTLKSLGGSGLRVNYGGGVTRRIDTVIRQNLLWGAKQASIAYNDMIGEELDCDGFEIDWHSNPRPSHEFMQGKQFAYGKARIVNGVYYPSGDEALQRLQDYNCYHFKTPIILGVSEPTYSQEELERLNRQNAEVFRIGDVEGNGYFWSQKMRQLETEIRKQKDTRILAKASGDNTLVRQCNERMVAFQKKYDEIAAITGITPDYERRAVTKTKDTLTISNNEVRITNRMSGAKKTIGWEQRHGEIMYEEIRHRTTDIKKISQYTSFKESAVEEIKKYMFFDEHRFQDGTIKRFDSDYYQAQAWDRLSRGKGTNTDILLLKHEYVELTQMRLKNLDYETAHEIANSKFNWWKAVESED
jgi:hypothetical protein|nr:MAG TPA: minor capsid protein [Caudoviricetes sp.]